MKKTILVFFLSICILSLSLSAVFAITFSDLKSTHWAYNDIMNLANDGIINGYKDGTYKPEKNVTRGEFLKLIMTSLYDGNEYFEVNNFNFGHWAMPYAIEAVNYNYLMDGTDSSGLNNDISRLEMVHILAKVCIKNSIINSKATSSIDFIDTEYLDENSKVFIDFVTENRLINGYTDGTFKPYKTMTRAEVATVISRFMSIK